MKLLEFGEGTNLSQILDSIKATEEEEVQIRLLASSSLSTSQVNREIIEKFAEKVGKKVSIQGSSVPEKPQSDFNFVEGKDIAQETEAEEEKAPAPSISGPVEERPSPEPIPLKKKPVGPGGFFGKLKGRKKLAVLVTGAISTFMVLGAVFFWFLPSATVNITAQKQSKIIQESLSASASATDVDTKNKVIPLSIEEVTESDIATATASGKLTVGTPAKGRVTVGNFSTVTSKKYPAGTSITAVGGASQGLIFTLDTAVTVPKATSSGFNIVAGQAGVNVTASKIGDKGNVSAGSDFQVDDESIGTVKATNDLDFSGGESHQITAVSDEDRKNLRAKLLAKLTQEAKKDLQNKLGGASVPNGGLSVQVTTEKYDKAAGEQAKEVNLTMEVTASAKLFKEEDLKKVLIGSMTVPDGYVIDESASQVSSKIIGTAGQDGAVQVLGKIKAVLVPDIKPEELAGYLAGKSFGAANSYLTTLKNISGFDIEIRPAIFRIFKILPFNKSRIKIDISEQDSAD